MKTRGLLSIVCAGCMLFGLMGSASAVNADAKTEISQFAGTAKTVQVINATFDGVTKSTYTIDVPIPAGTTKAQENDLVKVAVNHAELSRAAADSAAMNSDASNNGLFDEISYEDCITLYSGGYMSVGGGTLSETYHSLLVMFDGPFTIYNGASEIQVRVNSSAAPTIDYDLSADVSGSSADAYVVYISGWSYGGGTITMPGNAVLSVYAKSDAGGVGIGSCTVSASVYDIS